MKTSLLPKTIITLSLKAIMLGVTMFISSFSFAVNGGKLDFNNATLVSGKAGANGSVYKFSNIGNNLDALVTIIGRSDSLVYLVTMDMASCGFNKAWQPQVGYNKGTAAKAADWWMEFQVSFVIRNTQTAALVDEFNLSAIDIDGNGDKIHEYVSFYGLQSYQLETNSLLSVLRLSSVTNGVSTNLGARFDGPTRNFTNIDTSATAVMTTAKYIRNQSFTIRAGAVASAANGAADRMYSLYFQSFTYTAPALSTLPVTLTSFDSKLMASKVVLDWACAEQVNFSHFIVERSVNGKEFNDVTMIFTDEHSTQYKYSYSETVNPNASGLIYYRLKMVDRDGSFKYSAVRIIKLNQKNSQVAVSTYPNPVVNELRITIPSGWQNKKVTYDMINMNGVVVKHSVSENASQTETLQVNDLRTGTYVIRLNANNESATQMIVKK